MYTPLTGAALVKYIHFNFVDDGCNTMHRMQFLLQGTRTIKKFENGGLLRRF